MNLDKLAIQWTKIVKENWIDGLFICGINHGVDEKKKAEGTKATPVIKSFFSDASTNQTRFRNTLVKWFELWGWPLSGNAQSAGILERSIVQTNWMPLGYPPDFSGKTVSLDVADFVRESHEFLETCAALKPGLILLFGKNLFNAFTHAKLEKQVCAIFGGKTGDCEYYPGNGFVISTQQYERARIAGLPHPRHHGLSHKDIQAFAPVMSRMIDLWFKSHCKLLEDKPA